MYDWYEITSNLVEIWSRYNQAVKNAVDSGGDGGDVYEAESIYKELEEAMKQAGEKL